VTPTRYFAQILTGYPVASLGSAAARRMQERDCRNSAIAGKPSTLIAYFGADKEASNA
jgi:hypothetical protein